MKFNHLDRNSQRQLLNEASLRLHLDAISIEKDWWVTTVLRALFKLPYAEYLSLKGGTSLSKCWGLIDRFSEDADIGIAREYLGFSGDLSKTQISDKLRRAACSFVRNRLCVDLEQQLLRDGLSKSQFEVAVNITPISTTDPEVIDVIYISCLDNSLAGDYIMPKVKIEVSGRSMTEPIADVEINSLISKAFIGTPIEEDAFNIGAVRPERTFLEKVFLLHEEFSKGKELRVDRMSRHMYDIFKMIPAIAYNAIADERLYTNVIEHRRKFIGLKGFDYDSLYPKYLNVVPNDEIKAKWRKDYDKMQMFMIYGFAPTFEDMISALKQLNMKIRELPYSPVEK